MSSIKERFLSVRGGLNQVSAGVLHIKATVDGELSVEQLARGGSSMGQREPTRIWRL